MSMRPSFVVGLTEEIIRAEQNGLVDPTQANRKVLGELFARIIAPLAELGSCAVESRLPERRGLDPCSDS
jgi:hypothetical protein